MTPGKPPPTTFTLTLVAYDRDAAVRGLRILLKAAWRRYRMRCTDLRELASVPETSSGNPPDQEDAP
jgi:hypothetical protein